MFRSINSLPAGSYFRSECGRAGQVVEDMHGYVKVLYTDRDGKQQRSEWAPATQVIPLRTMPEQQRQAEDDNKVQEVSKPKGDGKRREKIFGRPVTHILRWMGQQGWDERKAVAALARFGITKSRVTVLAMLKAGAGHPKYVRYGKAPMLSKTEAKQLTGGK